MSDEIDAASELEHFQRERLIAKARQIKPKIFTGRCAYCNDVISENDRVYCSPECRDDHELEMAAMRRHNGRC